MESSNTLVLSHSIEINTSKEKLWNFFYNLPANYKKWHPKDHIVFKWLDGEPLENGTTFYAEQYVNGKVTNYKGHCAEIKKYKKIAFKFSFPVSIITSKIEWLFEQIDESYRFTAITYMRFGKLLQKTFKKSMTELITSHNEHVAFEGENLKILLEKTKYGI